jgi:peptide/nickel transport system permease protein
MLPTLARRALSGAAVVLGVVTLTFFLLHLAPGDPVDLLLAPTATPEQAAAQRDALGLDRPLYAQYLAWLADFARGDWGRSFETGRPVAEMIGRAWPPTVRLVALSLLLSYVLGIGIGAAQATRSGSAIDTVISVGTVTLFALPGYWLGLMLVMAFSYQARLFPAFGAGGFDADYLSGPARLLDGLRHLTLPLVTLVLIGVGGVARFVRGATLDVLAQPFVAAAHAKGLPPKLVLRRHVLRNALLPMLTLLGLSLPALFSGVVFVEAVFAWPGVGGLLVQAVQARDYPVVMAATTVSAMLVVAGNILADALAAVADPRLRSSAPGPAA